MTVGPTAASTRLDRAGPRTYNRATDERTRAEAARAARALALGLGMGAILLLLSRRRARRQ